MFAIQHEMFAEVLSKAAFTNFSNKVYSEYKVTSEGNFKSPTQDTVSAWQIHHSIFGQNWKT